MSTLKCRRSDVYRNMLIALRLLNSDGTIDYSAAVPTTRWGEAISRLLAERGWTKKQLAEAAKIRPNTITNLIKHGRASDTTTLARIAAAFKVDVAELFLTREQSVLFRSHRESRVERLKDSILKEISRTVTDLVRRELGEDGEPSSPVTPSATRRARPRRRSSARSRATDKS